MINLNEEALDAAGIDEGYARDLAVIMQGMANSASQAAVRPQTEPETSPEPETIPEPTIAADQNPVVFRVQIISSLYENSFPSVLIDGKSYKTYEYFYLGSYRITVGRFGTPEEANAFRTQCLNSGFKQAFVAAFRGDERETDPSVFK
jgi:hypothetical protein